MEAKLIKKSENYYELYEVRTNLTLLIGSTDSERKIDVYGKDAHKLLSLKNCQAIERGYDFEELVEQEAKLHHTLSPKAFKRGIEIGFQKALEILGDNKFSEEDMVKCFNASMNEGWVRADFYIQSLQQTERDVEIVMEKVVDETKIIGAVKGVKGSGNKITTYKQVPKLDADGCLILKRK